VRFPLGKPYIQLYRWGFPHFRYLKCLVIKWIKCAKTFPINLLWLHTCKVTTTWTTCVKNMHWVVVPLLQKKYNVILVVNSILGRETTQNMHSFTLLAEKKILSSAHRVLFPSFDTCPLAKQWTNGNLNSLRVRVLHTKWRNNELAKWESSWWWLNQPIWKKMLVKLDHFPR